jgi:hypothetical protein
MELHVIREERGDSRDEALVGGMKCSVPKLVIVWVSRSLHLAISYRLLLAHPCNHRAHHKRHAFVTFP